MFFTIEKYEAGGRRQEAGGRRQEAGGRRQEVGGRRRGRWKLCFVKVQLGALSSPEELYSTNSAMLLPLYHVG
ncbi:MAG: hypothetical protein F6K41_38545, partial [Symploca sp. SIO3E6]|nr:hypothetical protein [Caldora sp. SIO3E6]